MKISLCTVPVGLDDGDTIAKVKPGVDTFVSPRSGGRHPVMPKIAIVSLMHWMEKHGYPRQTCDYYDIDMEMPTDARLEHYFREYQPDVVGLSAVVSTCYYQVCRLSKIIRATCPDAWIVMGGSMSASANSVLRRTDVDICVAGDGEMPWVKFLDYVKQHGRRRDYAALSDIRGLAYLDDNGELQSTGYGQSIPADDIPFPDYDILQAGLKDRPQDLAYYFRVGSEAIDFQTDPRSFDKHRNPMLADLWSSKGCVARCTFCQRSTKGYRVPLIESLDSHIAMLKERFNVGFINVIDENFASNREYAYDFARTMKKHDMLWIAVGVRVSSIEREDVRFFKEHGCTCLKFGVETGSQKIMNVMEKKFTVERVYQTLKHCADYDIFSPLAVMVGMPGETNETALATGRFLGRVAHMQGTDPQLMEEMSIFYALPLPGTPLYVYGQRIGLIGSSPKEEEDYLLQVSGTGASKLNYVNLNGAPLRDVIFWDWLVRLEMARTFLELDKKSPISRDSFFYRAVSDTDGLARRKDDLHKPLTVYGIISRIKSGLRTGVRAKLFYALDHFIEKFVLFNPWAHKLPRWLLYGTLKNMLYAMYLLQRALVRSMGRNFNLYKARPQIKSLNLEEQPAKVDITMSIRSIVQKKPAAHSTVGERNREILAIGL